MSEAPTSGAPLGFSPLGLLQSHCSVWLHLRSPPPPALDSSSVLCHSEVGACGRVSGPWLQKLLQAHSVLCPALPSGPLKWALEQV